MARFSYTIPITAGSPVCLGGSTFASLGKTLQTTALAQAGQAAQYSPVWVDPISIQMTAGGSGEGYVMDGVSYLVVPVVANNLSGGLAPSPTATSPGGQYEDSGRPIDLNMIWIDGSHTGDYMTIAGARRL